MYIQYFRRGPLGADIGQGGNTELLKPAETVTIDAVLRLWAVRKRDANSYELDRVTEDDGQIKWPVITSTS